MLKRWHRGGTNTIPAVVTHVCDGLEWAFHHGFCFSEETTVNITDKKTQIYEEMEIKLPVRRTDAMALSVAKRTESLARDKHWICQRRLKINLTRFMLPI